MPDIKFPLSSSPGVRALESAGRIINAFAEPLGDGRVAYRRLPGTRVWGTTPYEGFRGLFFDGTGLYAAFEDKLVRWGSPAGGASADVDDLPGSQPVYYARNNKQPEPDRVAVTDGNAFVFDEDSVDDYPDPDVGSPNSVSGQGGYFFFTYGDGKASASDVNGTDINPLDFATAESKPDALLRGVPFGGEMYMAGTGTIEVFSNTGNPTGFPYSYARTIQKGLLAPRAVGGFEDGFSTQIMFVADDNTVVRLVGYSVQKISSSDLDRAIEALGDKSLLEAKVYKSAGHAFFELSCPEWTWTFNLNTEKWSERRGHVIRRHRAMQAIFAWGKWLCGDVATGSILEITNAAFDECGDTLRFRLESARDGDFPNRTRINRVDIDAVVGVGDQNGLPNAVDPMIEISWCDDGDRWSTPLLRRLGRIGRSGEHPFILSAGTAGPQGRRYRLDVADPVYVSVMGGKFDADIRNR